MSDVPEARVPLFIHAYHEFEMSDKYVASLVCLEVRKCSGMANK